MTLRNQILAIGTFVLFGCLGLFSCSEQPVFDGPGTVQVAMRIVVGETTQPGITPQINDRSTRVDGYYEAGVGFENYIGIPKRDFRFLVFDTDNKYLSTFQAQTFIEEGDVTNRTYILCGGIPFEQAYPSDFKVVVLANWPQYPDALTVGVSTIEDVCNALESQYTYSPSFVPSATTPIPLFGVQELSGITFARGEQTWLGDIYLLRAMAKIEVYCSNWEMESVTLTKYNAQAFCAPTGVYKKGDYIHGNFDSASYPYDYVLTTHLVGGANNPSTNLAFKRTDATRKRYIVYVPEYRNVIAGTKTKAADATEISMKFDDDPNYYPLEFKYYTTPPTGVDAVTGDPFDLVRNNYYRYNVFKSGDFDIKVIVEVLPYRAVDLWPGFGGADAGDRPLDDDTEANS